MIVFSFEDMSGGGDSSTPPTGDGAGKLQNPFAKDKEGFLSFSSSTPQASNPGSGGGGPRGGRGNFVPKRGKINRLNNWERFGDFVADGDNRPFQHSRPSEDSPSRGGNVVAVIFIAVDYVVVDDDDDAVVVVKANLITLYLNCGFRPSSYPN